MQSPRLHFSRLGIAFSRNSTGIPRFIKNPAYHFHPYSSDQQAATSQNFDSNKDKIGRAYQPYESTKRAQFLNLDGGRTRETNGSLTQLECLLRRDSCGDEVQSPALKGAPPQMGRMSKKQLKKARPSPPAVLSHWLDIEDVAAREQYWAENRGYISPSSLPSILLGHLQLTENPSLKLKEFETSFLNESRATLRRRGLAMEDVTNWAWIVSAQDVKTMVERFVSTPSDKPSFLLLEILRRDILHVRSLKLLLIYTWDQILGKSRSDLTTMSEVQVDAIIPWSEVTTVPDGDAVSSCPLFAIEETTFQMILSRLLHQARLIWPPAIVSVSHMVAPFMLASLKGSSPMTLDNRTQRRLSKLHNHLIRLLALPSSITPFKSMVHSWQAQRVLLEMAGQFVPPLLLDQDSYRAVVQVQAALKKSEREAKAAQLRTRSWPPWRIEQDGMDAQRSPEDDLSRVVVAGMRTKESGYRDDMQDTAIRVLGGQDSDGTPTIQTRTFFKRRANVQNDAEAHMWAARIKSTRDVQEAWSAFTGFQEQGREPSLSMYFAMFGKLHAEQARSVRTFQTDISPGDGTEVLPPSDDNFSSFYRLRLQSPTIENLYQQMIRAGHRPSGRFLAFLIQHARTPNEALQVLRDSDMNSESVAFLSGSKVSSPAALEAISKSTLAAFIKLLCRFAPRVTSPAGTSTALDAISQQNRVEELPEKASLAIAEQDITELRRYYKRPRFNPLLQSAELLKSSQSRFRPAWYAFFRALSRRGVIVDRRLIGDPKNDILAWRVLVAALDDFHRCGLELDPYGFKTICNSLEKATLAFSKAIEEERDYVWQKKQVGIVVEEFLKLSEVKETGYRVIPSLLHSIDGSLLHAYVRVLGLNQAYGKILDVLEWMVTYHVLLHETANQSRNGPKLVRKAIVAMKIFFSGTKYEERAKQLVNGVKDWDGWPKESEAQQYVYRRVAEHEVSDS